MNSGELAGMAWTQAWQLAALIGVVAAVTRLVARRRPHLAHVLWLVVLAKCMTPPVMTSAGGIFCWLQPPRAFGTPPQSTFAADSRIAHLDVEPGSISQEWRDSADDLLAITAENRTAIAERADDRRAPSTAGSVGQSRGINGRPAESHPLVLSSVDRSETRCAALWRPLDVALPWLGSLWLAGSTAFLAIALIRWRSCLHRVRRGRVECRPDLDALVAELSQRFKLRRRVRLVVTSSRFGPAVVGLWRPTILLPAVIVKNKSACELEPIVAHELIHVRRGDLWIGLWQVIAQALWWFHPFVRVANRLATRAAEACCDEEVIAELKCDPERYARSLLDVLALQRGLLTVPAFPGMRPVDVTRERMERIMNLRQGCRPRTPVWCWLVMLLASVATLPGAAFVVLAKDEANPHRGGVDAAAAAVTPEPPKAESIRTRAIPVSSETRQQAKAYLSNATWTAELNYQFRTETGFCYFQDWEKVEPTGKIRFQPFAMIWRPEGHPAEQAPYTMVCDSVLVEFASDFDIMNRRPWRIVSAALEGKVQIGTVDGSVKASSARGMFRVHDGQGAAGGMERVTIALSGDVHWKFAGLEASATEMIVELQTTRAMDTDALRLTKLQLDGKALVEIGEYTAKADCIFVLFSPANSPEDTDGHQDTGGRCEGMDLLGNAVLIHTGGPEGITSNTRGESIRFRATGDELIAERAFRGGGQEIRPKDSHNRAMITKNGDDVGDSRRIKNRKYKVAAHEAIRDEFVTVNYSVADLVVPVGDVHLTVSEDGAAASANDDERPSKATGVPATDPKALAHFDALMSLIETTISPDSWDSHSGPGSMMPYRTTLSLVIRQKGSVHEEIVDLLQQLRRLQDLQVTLQVDVLTVADAAFKSLPFDLDSVRGDNVCHFTEVQAKGIRESVAKSGGEPMTSSPKLTLCNGQGAELKLRRRLKRAGWVPVPPVQLVPCISADRSAIRLKVAIGATQPLEALARSRDYVIKQGQTLLADITADLDSNRTPGLPGIPEEALRRNRKTPPAERVLLLITPRVMVQEEEAEATNVKRR